MRRSRREGKLSLAVRFMRQQADELEARQAAAEARRREAQSEGAAAKEEVEEG